MNEYILTIIVPPAYLFFMPASKLIQVFRAQWGLTSEGSFKQSPWIVLAGKNILDHGFGQPPSNYRSHDLGEGVLVPGMVNAHTHLELSMLKDQIPPSPGMGAFAAQVTEKRKNFSPQQVRQKAREAIDHAFSRGTYFFNDIANDAGFSGFLRNVSHFHGHRFLELLGFSEPFDQKRISEARIALEADRELLPTPHSLYGSSPDIMKFVRLKARNNSLSLHLFESEEEYGLVTETGQIFDFLQNIGQYRRHSKIFHKNLLKYLDHEGILSFKNIFLVHMTQARPVDIEYLGQRLPHSAWVFCHRSNRFLGYERKNLPDLLNSPIKMLIGTDSLASSPDVSVLDEILAIHAEGLIAESNLLQAATFSAYEYLNLHRYQVPYFFFAGAGPSLPSLAGATARLVQA